MTLVMGLKSGNQGLVIFDVRLFNSASRITSDQALKFFSVGNNIAVFVAGDVENSVLVKSEISQISQYVSISTLGENRCRLRTKLEDLCFSNSLSGLELLFVFLDVVNSNFRMVGCTFPNNMPRFEEQEQILLGNGRVLLSPCFQKTQTHKQIFDRSLTRLDLFRASLAMKQEIKNDLQSLDFSALEDLSISPVFMFADIEGSSLIVYGYEEETFSSNKQEETNYSFFKEGERIFFKNMITSEQLELVSVGERELYELLKTKPVKLKIPWNPRTPPTGCYGIQESFAPFGLPEFGGTHRLCRRLYRFSPLKAPFRGRILQKIKGESIEVQELYHPYFPEGKYVVLSVDSINETFENQLINNLFNDEWLSQYITEDEKRLLRRKNS